MKKPPAVAHEECAIAHNEGQQAAYAGKSVIPPQHGAGFLNGAFIVLALIDNGGFAPFIFTAFKVAAGVGGRDSAVVRGVDAAGGIIVGALCRVAVARAVPGVGGARYPFALAHKGGAQVFVVRAVGRESIVAFAALKPLCRSTEPLAGKTTGAANIIGAGGVFFVSPAGGINIFLVTAHLVRGGLGYTVFIFLLGEVGVKLLLKVIVQAALSGALMLFNHLAVFIVHRAYTLARAECCQ